MNEANLFIPDWAVTATCAPGFAGTAVIGQCTGGQLSAYSISGCNLDTDKDGVADDDEDCYENPDKTGYGYICGCDVSDNATTGYYNCPTQLDSRFYSIATVHFTASAGSYTWLTLNPNVWTETGAYFAINESSSVWSSTKGSGTLTSTSFVVSNSTLAFQAGYGGDLSNIKLMTKSDDTTFSKVRKQFKPARQGIREVFWDVSGLLNEVAVIVLENIPEGNRMYVNNIRLFDSVPGCLPDCITIEPSSNANLDLKIMGTTYEPVNQGTSFTDDVEVLYCATDTNGSLPVGTSPGGLFDQNFPIGFKYHNLGMERLPSCMMVKKLPGENTYHIAVGAGKRRFSFNVFNPMDADSSLHCVYPTQQPRCVDYSGALAGSLQADMHCAEGPPSVTCTETVLARNCPLGAKTACGSTKVQQDLLKCCDKDGNSASLCLGHSRRLGESIRFSESSVVDMDAAMICAHACYQSNNDGGTCDAWRLTDSEECVLALKCYPATYAQVTNLELSESRWNLLKNAMPFDGLEVTVRQLKTT